MRVVTAILALFINLAFPLAQPRQMTVFADPSPFWDTFARFDSGWYEKIARNGYDYAPGGRSNIAYFPVYPMLMRYVGGGLYGRYHAAYYLGGIIVSWVSFLVAMPALFALARLDVSDEEAERAVLLAMVFPFAFFFGLVYTESTFLLFTVLAFLGFRTGRWTLGGIAAAIAIATRVTGILMWPALVWIAWRRTRALNRDLLWAAVGLLIALTGFVWYCAFIYSITGSPFEWAATLQRWNYHPGQAVWSAPLGLVRQLLTHPYVYLASDPVGPYETLYGVTGTLFLLVTPIVWWRLGAGYGMFMLFNLVVPISSGVFEGLGRYCSVLFPCFVWLATFRSRLGTTIILVLFALFYTLGLALFTTLHQLF